jgi:hypothetical protein
MPKDQPIYDDEIDLLDLLKTFWDGKWLIISSVVLGTLIGFGYIQVTQQTPKYDVTVSYNAKNVICGEKEECMKLLLTGETATKVNTLSNNGWAIDKKDSSISLTTKTPLDVNEYEAQLERANKVITNKIYTDAKNELALIDAELGELPFDSEFAYNYMLPHIRIIRAVDAGQTALTSIIVSVSKMPSNVFEKLLFPSILGGLIGTVVVFIRNLIRKRKKQLAKT